jgi:hypothetical protein
MEDGSKQGKSTGYIPPIKMANADASAPVESTAKNETSPVYQNALTRVESLISIPEVSPSEILAIQIILGDFKAVTAIMPKSWLASSNGKIYFCIQSTGHELSVRNGELLVDGNTGGSIMEKILDTQDDGEKEL